MLPGVFRSTRPTARWVLGGLVAGAALFALSWWDVLPGGWTLRGWVEPHAVREQRAREQHARERLEHFEVANRGSRADPIVFAGSSTIERFPLDDLFPDVGAHNRGIGDEPCEAFLERLAASTPDQMPSAWVLYLASVDFRRLNASPEQVQQRVGQVLNQLKVADRQVRLFLIGILPEQDMSEDMKSRLVETNALLADLCVMPDCVFVDTARPPITAADGSLAPEFATDQLHLNRRGYGVLAEWLVEASPFLAGRLRPVRKSPEEGEPSTGD